MSCEKAIFWAISERVSFSTGNEMGKGRLERLQIMLDSNELAALETWRFKTQMPSRAAAVRELLRRGLAAAGFEVANLGDHSESYGVIKTPDPKKRT